MTCPKCGKEVRDGAKFCGYCGAPLTAVSTSVSSSTKIKPGHRQFLVIAAILLLLIIGAFMLFRMRSGKSGTADGVVDSVGSSDGYVAVYSDGNYSLVSLDGKHAVLPLGTIVYGDGDGYVPEVVFSPDEKYVFFYTTDTNGQNVNLYRVECSKLTTDLRKNQTLYTTVSTNRFYYDLIPMENGILLLYSEGTNQSFYFDGSKVTELPEDWYSITFDASGNYVYWADNAIWRVIGGDVSSARQIDSDVDRNSVHFLDSNNLIYQKNNTIYRISPDWIPHSIAEGFSVISGSDGAIYYIGGSDGNFEFLRWKDGVASTIADHILWYSYDSEFQSSKFLQYSTPDADVLFDLSSGQYAVVTEDADASLEAQISESGISDPAEVSFFITDSYFYVACDDAFFASALTNHVIGNFEQTCTGVYPLTQVGDTIYCTQYHIDSDNAYEFDTIDLYAVQDGGMYLVAPMVFPSTLNIYADGVITASGDGTNGPVWGLVKEGSANLPNALYISNYLGNEQFVYRTENELYFYDAHSADLVKLFDNPRWVWCSRGKEFIFTLGIYD